MPETPEQYDLPEPKKSRPVVYLVDKPVETQPNLILHRIEILDSQNQVIGNISVLERKKSGKPGDFKRETVAMIKQIDLAEQFIGKGFGKAAYLELLKMLRDTPLVSASTNQDSNKIWESLVRDGLAEYDEPEGKQEVKRYVSKPEAIRRYFENEE